MNSKSGAATSICPFNNLTTAKNKTEKNKSKKSKSMEEF
jgi:hypothetical protein